MDYLRMDQMPLNTQARIVDIEMDNSLKRKLADMGLVIGTQFQVNGKAPLGDPIKITLRGYNLAIRKSEARNILVEKV